MAIRPLLVLSGLVIVAPASLEAARVVGFAETVPGAYVAVRWRAERNSTLSGISFYSNDATVFPEVALAADGGYGRVPVVAATLRSVTNVVAQPGYTTVMFEPYVVGDGGEYLWALIRFPRRESLVGEGIGGGPGIGWITAGQLAEERSFFGGDESINEFTAAFDISLVMGLISGKAIESRSPVAGGHLRDQPALSVSPGSDRGVLIQFELTKAGKAELDIFNVFGRRVRRLLHARFDPGTYTQEWDGSDGRGRRVSSGIYFVVLHAHGSTMHRKVSLVR